MDFRLVPRLGLLGAAAMILAAGAVAAVWPGLVRSTPHHRAATSPSTATTISTPTSSSTSTSTTVAVTTTSAAVSTVPPVPAYAAGAPAPLAKSGSDPDIALIASLLIVTGGAIVWTEEHLRLVDPVGVGAWPGPYRPKHSKRRHRGS